MAIKYIFVTGGVVSGIGKGITAAVIGRLLKARGFSVRNQKFDPYINVDPGLMNPAQNGEVFITDDGAVADLDIGHYERFTDVSLDRESDITSGMIYGDVIRREREGGFLGTTVQVVPHIINEIKGHIFRLSQREQPDVLITEIGGTVGDMESLPYLEAIRQVSYEVGHANVIFVHVTLIPYLRKSGEIKTKPTQHSVGRLLSLGIQPDILVCRSEQPLDRAVREKIALFCNVSPACVIQSLDVQSLYQLPLMLEEEGLGQAVCDKLNITPLNEPDLGEWQLLSLKERAAFHKVRLTLVGQHVEQYDAYYSLVEAIRHAATERGVLPDISRVSAEELESSDPAALLADADAVFLAGNHGSPGLEGLVAAARFARTRQIPCLGIGVGMQMAVVEYARDVAGAAADTVFLPANMAGTGEMPGRRGASDSRLAPGSRLALAYGQEQIAERHDHPVEFCNDYRDDLANAGLVFSGWSADSRLVDAVELADHPWFVGVIFHPEFKSRPTRPHPLFLATIDAAIKRQAGQQSSPGDEPADRSDTQAVNDDRQAGPGKR